jgi:hypothetical protein
MRVPFLTPPEGVALARYGWFFDIEGNSWLNALAGGHGEMSWYFSTGYSRWIKLPMAAGT